MINAGWSTCPVCRRRWLVTPNDDCCQPSCGCYGKDTSADNPNRVCTPCAETHTEICSKPFVRAECRDCGSTYIVVSDDVPFCHTCKDEGRTGNNIGARLPGGEWEALTGAWEYRSVESTGRKR